MNYIITEVYTKVDGTVESPENSIFENRQLAESYYFTRVAQAAISTYVKHTVFMMNDDGRLIRVQPFTHTNTIAEILDEHNNVVAVEQTIPETIIQDEEPVEPAIEEKEETVE